MSTCLDDVVSAYYAYVEYIPRPQGDDYTFSLWSEYMGVLEAFAEEHGIKDVHELARAFGRYVCEMEDIDRRAEIRKDRTMEAFYDMVDYLSERSEGVAE